MFSLVRRQVWPTGLLLALRLILGSGTVTSPLLAVEAVRKSFALPAAAAEVTLEAFSDQTEIQIIYLIEDVRGVTTNAVRGEFAIRDALDRLVAGTALQVEHDGKTGAFVIRRKPPGSDQAAATRAVPNTHKPLPMKSRPVLSIIASWFALALPQASSATDAVPATASGAIEGRVQNVASGRYLPNARVSVLNTDIMVFTDETGRFRIPRAPAGNQFLEVFYTGLDVEKVAVRVVSGQTHTQDVGLTNAGLYGGRDSAVRLDPFLVASAKETDMATIAINEQRFAPNIKNVVATDTHGEVLSGNIGEFLKYIPGVDAGGGSYEPGGILIRGFPEHLTEVTTDGAPLANSGSANAPSDRTFSLSTVSINNVSRVEVTKVPTPATRADSLAGSVNMISKSAFESARRQLRYNLSLTSSESTLHFSRQPRADETRVLYVKPSGNLDLILPLKKNFGLSLAAQHYMVSSPLNRANRTYNATAVGTGASFGRPFLQQQQNPITTQFRTRDSYSLKADWRVTPHGVLSASYQYSAYDQDSMNYSFQANTNPQATPAVAGGVPLTFGPDFTIGATGRGAAGQTAGFNLLHNTFNGGNVSYRYDSGVWKIDGMASASNGRSKTDNEADGFFRGFQTGVRAPVRVSFFDITDLGPGRVEMYTNENRPFDFYDVNNFVVNNNGVSSQRTNVRNGMRAGSIDVKRRTDLLAVPTSFQAGVASREQTLDRQSVTRNYTFNGINGSQSAAPFAAKVYYNIEEPLITGLERTPAAKRGVPYVSPHLAWRAFQENPALFTSTPAQLVASERARRTNSQYFSETVDALYLQTEMRFWRNRLNALTGVRHEKTTTYGEGLLNNASAVFLRDPDGSFTHNAAGARLRRPEAGAAGSMQELEVTLTERGYKSKRSYAGYYPSLHLTYQIKENFLARAAYARTYGRPNYSEIIPNTSANENDLGDEPDPNAVLGTLTVRNTGLIPWTAGNYDISLEYYTASGGLLGASVFHKDIKNFFGTFAKVATASDLAMLGLGPEYVGWQVNTSINAGNARVSGFELSVDQSLAPLGRWGRFFRGFANFTKIEVNGPSQADFSGFLPKTANWGLTYNRAPFVVMAKWNHRADVQQAPIPALGPDAFNYLRGGTRLDVNISYQVTKRMSVFFNARNATGRTDTVVRYGSETPEYAKVYMRTSFGGAILNLGIKGTY